ncbi:Clp protease [Hartmannibacter diazotrophicus]|uniref:Clp protease n=1 Tax=Hartmannibacter diazotrophicus TaxID=1482074 RepID=A0A2C9D9U5_9HYPH|nr:ATP-dependent Clp protease proteolytic subunit [Hartmannibacter diazotrophicus]SON57046.1 Clp protease [Hartmannibacter diazotrophicus]
MSADAPQANGRFATWRRAFFRNPDEAILRVVFVALLMVASVAIGTDFGERLAAQQAERARAPAEQLATPNLPSARPGVIDPAHSKPAGDGPDLSQPMTLELLANGRLEATGTIVAGTAERLTDELDKRGSYVTTVVLNSPGGSVSDAIAMARTIRAHGLTTQVEKDGRCASSCPLVFSGGSERIAAEGAAIGVHQVFSVASAAELIGQSLPEGLAEGQRITAECQRLLVDMGVDPRVWIHALETPPRQIFYFTGDELKEFALATTVE